MRGFGRPSDPLEGISSVNHLLNITDSSGDGDELLLAVFPAAFRVNSRLIFSVLKDSVHRQQDFLLRLVFAPSTRTPKFSRGINDSPNPQEPFGGFSLLWCGGAFLKVDFS